MLTKAHKMNDIAFLAKQALGRVQRGDFENLSSAVKGLRKEAGLNDEMTHRLIEAVNREAHAHNFNTDSPSYVTFDIARPDEIFDGEEKLASEIYIRSIRPVSKGRSEYIPGSEFINPLDAFGVEGSTKLAGRRPPEERPFAVKEAANELLKLAREEVIVSRMKLCDSLETFLKEATNALCDNTIDDLATFVALTEPCDLVKSAFAHLPKLARERDIYVKRGSVKGTPKADKKHPLFKSCEKVKEAEIRAACAISDLREATIAHHTMHKYAAGELEKAAALKEIFEKCAGILGSVAGAPLMFGVHGLSTIPFVLGKKNEYLLKGKPYQPKPTYGHELRKTGDEKSAGFASRALKIGIPTAALAVGLGTPQGQKAITSAFDSVVGNPAAYKAQEALAPTVNKVEQYIPKLGEDESKEAGLRLSVGSTARKPQTVGRLAQNAAKWGLALGLASVIGGAGGSALSSAIESGDKALNLGGAISRAVEHDPDLRKIPKKKLVTGASTLWDLNKDFAKQPMLMASWLKRVDQMPDAALALAPQMLGAHEKAIKARTAPGTLTGALRGLSKGSPDVLDL